MTKHEVLIECKRQFIRDMSESSPAYMAEQYKLIALMLKKEKIGEVASEQILMLGIIDMVGAFIYGNRYEKQIDIVLSELEKV